MPRLPPSALPAFAHLTSTHLNGLSIAPASAGIGLILQHTTPALPLLTLSPTLILCASSVDLAAKSSPHLAAILRAASDLALTPRGAILIYLFLQLTNGTKDVWSEYTKFLPSHVSLPTTWTDTERQLLLGTSLHTAVHAKLASLEYEFNNLRTTTSSIPWCQQHWWDAAEPPTLHTWIHADSLFRSRALQFPSLGVGMAPFLDFANHSCDANAWYREQDGAVVLVPREGCSIAGGEEVTINYGEEKSAAEFLFSYGFIPASLESARYLVLDIPRQRDDPLALAKETVFGRAPVLRIEEVEGGVEWTGDFVWLMCVNEEDGLSFRVVQSVDGGRELLMLWCGEEMQVGGLEERLRVSEMWEVYQLRALAMVVERLEVQLGVEVEEGVGEVGEVGEVVGRLRGLERRLLERAVEVFEGRKERLMEGEVVRGYLRRFEEGEGEVGEMRGEDEDEEDLR